MEIREHTSPRAHVVADDFLPRAEARRMLRSLRALEPRMTVGLVRTPEGLKKSTAKENRVLFVDDDDDDEAARAVLAVLRRRVWSDELLDALEDADAPLLHVLQYTGAPSVQISRYAAGDYYELHRDVGNKTNLTVLLFLCAEPQRFSGGNLVLEHRGKSRTVRFRNNRLVVFGSNTFHRVTRVRAASDRFTHARFSLQIWPAIVPGKTAGPRALRALREEDQARHAGAPVFAVAPGDVRGVAGSLEALVSGRHVAIEQLDLIPFLRFADRSISNLAFLARSLFGRADFEAMVACPGGVPGPTTELFLRHEGRAARFDFGYRVRPAGARPSGALFARLRAGDTEVERARIIGWKADHRRSAELLRRLVRECLAATSGPAGPPRDLAFLASF